MYPSENDEREARKEGITFVSDEELDPPFGWADALDGCYVNRWGWELARDQYGMNGQGYRMLLWGWLGFAFFDKDRVLGLKHLRICRDFKTGFIDTE